MTQLAYLGVFGLSTMGANLARNAARKGLSSPYTIVTEGEQMSLSPTTVRKGVSSQPKALSA